MEAAEGEHSTISTDGGKDNDVRILRVMIFLPPRYHLLIRASMRSDSTILDIRYRWATSSR